MRNPIEILTHSPLWAIRPEATLAAIMSLIDTTAFGGAAGWEAAAPHLVGDAAKVAIVPVYGNLTKDGPAWYGANYDGISKAVESAVKNPDVKRIVLSVDSPGGEVRGCPEAAAVIRQAAHVKQVSAIVEGQAASAAYWLTSQASDITVTPSGEVGSVGIKMIHTDLSAMLDKQGIKITQLTAGAHKGEWSPYGALSDEAKAVMQTRMDAVHTDFLNAISSARGERASQDIKDQQFGGGRMFSASDAMNHGLVDKVLSTRDFYKTLVPAPEVAAPKIMRASLAARLEHCRILARTATF